MESTISAVTVTSVNDGLIANKEYTYELIKLFLTWPGVLFLIAVIYIPLIKVIHLRKIFEYITNNIKSIPTPFGPLGLRAQNQKVKEEEDRKKFEEVKSQLNKEIQGIVIPYVNSLLETIEFERIWSAIYRGQLEILLLCLKEPINFSNAFDIFSRAAKVNPALNQYGFTSYLNYIINLNLINYLPNKNGVPDNLNITPRGINFLKYIFGERKYDINQKGF